MEFAEIAARSKLPQPLGNQIEANIQQSNNARSPQIYKVMELVCGQEER
jgi:hypothetical protein